MPTWHGGKLYEKGGTPEEFAVRKETPAIRYQGVAMTNEKGHFHRGAQTCPPSVSAR